VFSCGLLAYLVLVADVSCQLGNQVPAESQREQQDTPLAAFIVVKEPRREPGDDQLRNLLKLRHNAIAIALELRYKEWNAGRGTQGFLFRDAEYWRKARLELSTTDKERLAILQQYIDWTKAIEGLSKSRYEKGLIALHDWKESKYYLLDAQIDYVRAQRATKGP
jgi:hypothetical protein